MCVGVGAGLGPREGAHMQGKSKAGGLAARVCTCTHACMYVCVCVCMGHVRRVCGHVATKSEKNAITRPCSADSNLRHFTKRDLARCSLLN